MISSYSADYCLSKDIYKIKNFQTATTDWKRKWVCWHRNHISGIGFIPRNTLIRAGLWLYRPARELIFLKRSEVKRLEAAIPTATISNSKMMGNVLKAWVELNPNSLLISLDMEEFKLLARSISRLRVLRAQMNARCHNPDSQDYRWYGAKGIKVCDEWRNDSWAFVMWALKNGYRYNPNLIKGEQLSIDRIDPSKDYCPENCRWIPHRENCRRVKVTREAMSKAQAKAQSRRRKMRKIFTDCTIKRGFIDWEKVLKRHFKGEWSKLKNFLIQHDYTTISISKIHRRILGG